LGCFAEDLAWLCYELGAYRPVAVGHGIGGIIATELAGRCPNLLAAVVAVDAPLVLRPEARVGIQEIIGQRHTAAHEESRAVWPANDSQQEHVVAAMTTTPHLAATWQNAMIWDAAALGRCAVPVLYVQLQTTRRADVERLRTACPHMVVESIGHDQLDERAAPEQVNALIDAFLQGSLAESLRNW
jgi:pimeloyl-ACP methyl ester carboxylesterase